MKTPKVNGRVLFTSRETIDKVWLSEPRVAYVTVVHTADIVDLLIGYPCGWITAAGVQRGDAPGQWNFSTEPFDVIDSPEENSMAYEDTPKASSPKTITFEKVGDALEDALKTYTGGGASRLSIKEKSELHAMIEAW